MSLRSLTKLAIGAGLSVGLGGIIYYDYGTSEWWIALALFLCASTIALGMWRLLATRMGTESVAQEERHTATNELAEVQTGRHFGAKIGTAGQTPGRVFVQRTPTELSNLVKGKTSIESEGSTEPYIGCWLRVQGEVSNVFELGGSLVVYMREESLSEPLVSLNFSDEKWYKALRILRVDDSIHASGEIESIDVFRIRLKRCELDP